MQQQDNVITRTNAWGQKIKRSEFYWYKPLRKHLERSGMTTWQEVEFSNSSGMHNELDIVGLRRTKRGIRLYSIEVKEGDVPTVIYQAIQRRLVCDYCYIALPLRRKAGRLAYIIYKLAESYQFLRKEGIGVLLYDEVAKKVIEPFYARRSKIIHQSLREELLRVLEQQKSQGS